MLTPVKPVTYRKLLFVLKRFQELILELELAQPLPRSFQQGFLIFEIF